MTPEQIFAFSNATVALGWLILIAGGKKRWAPYLVAGVVIPLLFAVLYTLLILKYWSGAEGGFDSISAVQSLFANPWLLLAGWIHYLSFDLFIGSWLVREAQANGIPHLVTIPFIVLTSVFGPIGLLLFFVFRTWKRRTLWLADESSHSPLRNPSA